MTKNHVLILLILLCCICLPGCANNPVTSQQQFMVITEEDELKIGQEADLVIKEKFGVYHDPILTGYIDRIGQDIAMHSDRPHIPYYFTILDSSIENAFALPGGYVYITRGLLVRLNSEAELANVLAHEITHIAARHSVQQMSQMYGYQLAWISAGILLQQQNISRWKQLADIGVQIVLLGYSREHELESDGMGIRYAYAAGYAPQAMASFLGTLEQEDRYREQPPEWLSTHPATTERIARLQQETQRLLQRGPDRALLINADRYKEMLSGIPLGPGPHSGEVNGRQYKNKYFGFRVTAPKNWTITRDTPGVLVSFIAPDTHDIAHVQAMHTPKPLTPKEWQERFEPGFGNTRTTLSTAQFTGPLHGISVFYIATKDAKTVQERRDYLTSNLTAYTLTYVPAQDMTPSLNERFSDIRDSFTLLSKEESQMGYTDHLVVYTVRPEDTIDTVAQQYIPVRAKDILVYNGLSSNAVLTSGEKLKIPPRKDK